MNSHGNRDRKTQLTVTVGNDLDTGPHVSAVWHGGCVSVNVEGHETLIIGRSGQCDLTIEHASVSRKHARIRFAPELVVEDLGSSNGTRVRGVALDPHCPVALAPGEIVEIGSAVLFVRGRDGHEPNSGVRSVSNRRKGGAPTVTGSPSSSMQAIDALLSLVAASDISIVLAGETGVGKEVAAELVHARSKRAGGPLVRLNCAAVMEGLLESELFGHAKGAFTGAHAPKLGLIEAAHGGTLFLDEVGEMPLTTQAKLLRVLETRELLRLGEVKPRTVDVRFVAATNRDLPALVADGRFRQDLYFRLNGITVDIPPLRARLDEIPRLVDVFAQAASRRLARPAPALSRAALDELRRHSWPGNVRELRNVMDLAVVLCNGPEIGPEHLRIERRADRVENPPVELAPATVPSTRLCDDVQALERRRIVDALDVCSGNQSRAAKLLGISRRTLATRLEAFGLPRPRKGRGATGS